MYQPEFATSRKLYKSGVMTCCAAVLVSSLAAAAPPKLEVRAIRTYAKTQVVKPVPGSPEESGKALLAAMKRLKSDKPNGRWLVKVEPGVYDLGEQALVLRSDIDVEGSGPTRTEIVGLGQDYFGPDFNFRKGVVVGASGTELRNLTVRCQNTNLLNACIVMSNYNASPTLIDVRLLATDAEGEGHWGMRNDNSSPILDDVEILVEGGVNNYALVNSFSGSQPQIWRSSLTAQDGTGQNVGIFNKILAVPALLHTVDIAVVGGNLAAGVMAIDTEEEEIESDASAFPPFRMFAVDIEARDSLENVGVLGGQITLELRQSRVTIVDGSALNVGTRGNVDVRDSELRATDFLAHGDHVRIVATGLLGGGDVLGYSEETCIAVTTEGGTSDVCP